MTKPAGPIATTLTSPGTGAPAPDLIGALTNMGLRVRSANYYAEEVRRGRVLVIDATDDNLADRVVSLMKPWAMAWQATTYQPAQTAESARSVTIMNARLEDTKTVEPEETVLQLYKSYESRIDPHLWPWETKRWHELVFCLLTSIAEPEISAETTREVTRALAEWRLLDIDLLASIHPSQTGKDATNPVLVTIATILQQAGFEADKSMAGVAAICEAASGFQQNYESKVQKYFRKYGALMLEEVTQNFSFSGITGDEARRAVALWLQNTLNMPVPASNPITDAVCKRLGIEYSTLLKAADDLDINIALLDEALMAYWEDELEEEEFLPAENESSTNKS